MDDVYSMTGVSIRFRNGRCFRRLRSPVPREFPWEIIVGTVGLPIHSGNDKYPSLSFASLEAASLYAIERDFTIGHYTIKHHYEVTAPAGPFPYRNVKHNWSKEGF